MKFCPKCMQENDDTAVVCQRCGNPFESAQASCPRGHLIDPTWTECPYCLAEQGSPNVAAVSFEPAVRPKTVVEGQDAYADQPPRLEYGAPAGMGVPVPPPAPPPAIPMENAGAYPPPPPIPAAQRRKTEFMGVPSAQTPTEPRRGVDRRIVGVLVTYSWRPDGQIFPVREGRNLIGRGAECEISLPDDSTLSNVNSHITYRKSFIIGDMVSMSGTYLNDHPVEEQFVPLPNYASIRTGSTLWTFIAIQPTAG